MTVTSDVFTGWLHIGLTVRTGAQPAGTFSLALLANRENYEQLLPAMLTRTGDKRQAALTILHYAVYAVSSILIAPLVYDGIALDTTSDQLGLVLDETANVTALWVGRVEPTHAAHPITQVGALTMHLLAPVVEAARQVGKVSTRAVNNITLDALANGCRRLERACGRTPTVGWVEEFIAAMGHPTYKSARPLLAYPDAGPAVEFYVPRTCCVLHSKPGAHACPTCPQYPDDTTRLQKINEWLSAMDDNDFRRITGRMRMAHVVG